MIPADILAIVRPYTLLFPHSLELLYEHALNAPPGSFVECGLWRGGSSALLAYIAKQSGRLLYCFDSFEGMPEPDSCDISGGKAVLCKGALAMGIDQLTEVCNKLDVLDVVRPIKGLFKDTLPEYRDTVKPIAFLHADADFYASTMDILTNLYDAVITGGHIQFDDYSVWDGCKKAVDEFFQHRNITPKINDGLWLIK